jgi:hypothetical protein
LATVQVPTETLRHRIGVEHGAELIGLGRAEDGQGKLRRRWLNLGRGDGAHHGRGRDRLAGPACACPA